MNWDVLESGRDKMNEGLTVSARIGGLKET
jgi:hypothetical protein